MRHLIAITALVALGALGACSSSTSSSEVEESLPAQASTTTSDPVDTAEPATSDPVSVPTDTAAPEPVETVAALAALLDQSGVTCTGVAGEEAVPGINVDSGTCVGPDGIVLQLNVFATDADAAAGRAFIATTLQSFGMTEAPGVVSGRLMVSGDSDNPTPGTLEQIAGILNGELVNLAVV